MEEGGSGVISLSTLINIIKYEKLQYEDTVNTNGGDKKREDVRGLVDLLTSLSKTIDEAVLVYATTVGRLNGLVDHCIDNGSGWGDLSEDDGVNISDVARAVRDAVNAARI